MTLSCCLYNQIYCFYVLFDVRCLKISTCAQFSIFSQEYSILLASWPTKGRRVLFFTSPCVFRSIHTYPYTFFLSVPGALVAAEGPEERSSPRSAGQKCELDQTRQIRTLSSLSKFFSPFLLFCFAEGITFCVHHKWAGVPVMV